MTYIKLFLLGTLAGMLALPSTSLGAWKRQSATMCGNINGTSSLGAASDFGWAMQYPERPGFCPYDDDSLIPKTSLTTFNVHGEGPVTVSACVKYWNASGGSLVGFACDSPSTTSASGVWSLAPAITNWKNVFNAGHFSYLRVAAAGPGTGVVYVYGWYSAF